jgi:hypothetical protein
LLNINLDVFNGLAPRLPKTLWSQNILQGKRYKWQRCECIMQALRVGKGEFSDREATALNWQEAAL